MLLPNGLVDQSSILPALLAEIASLRPGIYTLDTRFGYERNHRAKASCGRGAGERIDCRDRWYKIFANKSASSGSKAQNSNPDVSLFTTLFFVSV